MGPEVAEEAGSGIFDPNEEVSVQDAGPRDRPGSPSAFLVWLR